MGILQQNSVAEDRPPWFYFVAVWLVTIATVFALVEPIGNPAARHYEETAYILRFLFGLERTAIFIRYRYKYGRVIPSLLIRRINTYVIITSVLILFGGAGYGAYQILSAKVDTIQEGAFSADSIAVRAGKLLIVESNRQKREDGLKIEQLQLSNKHLTAQVENTIRLIRVQNETIMALRMDYHRVVIQMQKQTELLRRQNSPLPLLRGRTSMLMGYPDSLYVARQHDSH